MQKKCTVTADKFTDFHFLYYETLMTPLSTNKFIYVDTVSVCRLLPKVYEQEMESLMRVAVPVDINYLINEMTELEPVRQTTFSLDQCHQTYIHNISSFTN